MRRSKCPFDIFIYICTFLLKYVLFTLMFPFYSLILSFLMIVSDPVSFQLTPFSVHMPLTFVTILFLPLYFFPGLHVAYIYTNSVEAL